MSYMHCEVPIAYLDRQDAAEICKITSFQRFSDSLPLIKRQGCLGYGNFHGDPHPHRNPIGIPMGIPTVLNLPTEVNSILCTYSIKL